MFQSESHACKDASESHCSLTISYQQIILTKHFQFLTSLSCIDSHALNLFSSDLKAYILEATRTRQHKFSY